MTAADIHVCSCGKEYPADVDPHEWKPRDAAADKPPATAANPVVPASAVEKAARAMDKLVPNSDGVLWGYTDQETGESRPGPTLQDAADAALTAGAVDLIAANTDEEAQAYIAEWKQRYEATFEKLREAKRRLAANTDDTKADALEEAADDSPFESLPSGLDIAHYFWEETDHQNPGYNGIGLYRDDNDYCYLWVEAMVDLDMYHSYLLDVRTHVAVTPGEFGETRDYLYLFAGAGGRFDVEWHNEPIDFSAPSEQHWERFANGMGWLTRLTEKSIEDADDAALRTDTTHKEQP